MTIKIIDLNVLAKHGCKPEEKKRAQTFLVCCELECEYLPTLSDDINSTVNYAEVCDFIAHIMQSNCFNLIETCADTIAMEMLKKYPAAKMVKVEVKKPEVQLGHKLTYVSATINRTRSTAYLGLGANLGNREANIKAALNLLECSGSVIIERVSSLIEYEPYGKKDQPKFLNAAAKISTFLSPHELLKLIKETEKQLGRKQREKWGPREIDIDILTFDSFKINTPHLAIPHPDFHNREFVLHPLVELEPALLHPIFRVDMLTLKKALDNHIKL